MLMQLISTVSTLGLIVLAILIMTRAISFEETGRAIGKVLLVLVFVLVAVCSLTPALQRGVAALGLLITTAIRLLLVTVSVIAVLMLFVWVLSRLFNRSQTPSSHD